MATFVHDGEAIDYTPTADVAAGQVVVQGDLVGVAKVDIPAGRLGALAVAGVFDFPKGAGSIAVGTLLYWDAANQEATTSPTGNKLIGKCVKAAGEDDPIVRVRLSQ